jgi:hypothetical protein
MSAAEAAWDGSDGTAGGAAFGAALAALAAERGLDASALSGASGETEEALRGVLAGSRRVSVSALARYAAALKVKALEFLQRCSLLSLDTYAAGLDPLYFLPPGPVRHDARIYMREINPRHPVPERDMFVRNPVLKELASDTVLDDVGKLEVTIAYLLRAAVQHTGGTL